MEDSKIQQELPFLMKLMPKKSVSTAPIMAALLTLMCLTTPTWVRKRYFKNERFMEAWIEGINYLIRQWDTIREKFMG